MADEKVYQTDRIPPLAPTDWFETIEESGPDKKACDRFRKIILNFYSRHGRKFCWREQISPYRVLVSELMLQQTQTTRVMTKFPAFMSRFPDMESLAAAPFSEVLKVWKGLGYNRRARYLHDIAQLLVADYGATLPDDPDVLVRFPGIGAATAASICVFAFNRPLAFIETNIRTVFIYFFFFDNEHITDRQIIPLVEATLDFKSPRDWYYGLMDYGVMLKKTVGNLNRRSQHYQRQSAFTGSDRQLRGKILQLIIDRTVVEEQELPGLLGEPEERVERLVGALNKEGIVIRRGRNLLLD